MHPVDLLREVGRSIPGERRRRRRCHHDGGVEGASFHGHIARREISHTITAVVHGRCDERIWSPRAQPAIACRLQCSASSSHFSRSSRYHVNSRVCLEKNAVILCADLTTPEFESCLCDRGLCCSATPLPSKRLAADRIRCDNEPLHIRKDCNERDADRGW